MCMKTYAMLYEWIKVALHAIFAKVHQRHFIRNYSASYI